MVNNSHLEANFGPGWYQKDSDKFKAEQSIGSEEGKILMHKANKDIKNVSKNPVNRENFAFFKPNETEESNDEYEFSQFEKHLIEMNSKKMSVLKPNPEIENSSMYDNLPHSCASELRYSF